MDDFQEQTLFINVGALSINYGLCKIGKIGSIFIATTALLKLLKVTFF